MSSSARRKPNSVRQRAQISPCGQPSSIPLGNSRLDGSVQRAQPRCGLPIGLAGDPCCAKVGGPVAEVYQPSASNAWNVNFNNGNSNNNDITNNNRVRCVR